MALPFALAAPLDRALEITPHGQYGVPRPNRNGTHWGIDLRARKGDLVRSMTPGTVARTGFDKPVPQGGGGGGNYVIVSTAGYEIGYFHLDRIDAHAGQRVGVGDVLGLAGDSGTESSGAHLHLQMKIGGSPVDFTADLPLGAAAVLAAGGGVVFAVLAGVATYYLFLRRR